MGLFGTAHGWGESKKVPLPKISHTYPTMIKLGTVVPYQRKIQKIHELRKFCYIKKYRHKFHFDS